MHCPRSSWCGCGAKSACSYTTNERISFPFIRLHSLTWFNNSCSLFLLNRCNFSADKVECGFVCKLPWDRCRMVKSYPINLVLGKQPVLQHSTDRRLLWICHHHRYLCCFQTLSLNKERLRLFIDKRFHSELLGMIEKGFILDYPKSDFGQLFLFGLEWLVYMVFIVYAAEQINENVFLARLAQARIHAQNPNCLIDRNYDRH